MFSLGVNGYAVLTGDEAVHAMFLSFLAKSPVEVSSFSVLLLKLSVIVGFLAIVFFAVGLVRELLQKKAVGYYSWGLWTAMLSIVLYGLPVRLASNHNLAATLFFFAGLLFLLMMWVSKREEISCSFFDKVKLLPVYFLALYTMGQPGYNKLFNTDAVMGGYVRMFEGSILAEMPGGIPPFIYFLGVLEVLVFVLFLVSFLMGEFLPNHKKIVLKTGLMVMNATFVMLSFGLGLLLIYPGAVQLLMYAAFTTLIYASVDRDTTDTL